MTATLSFFRTWRRVVLPALSRPRKSNSTRELVQVFIFVAVEAVREIELTSMLIRQAERCSGRM
jgi:hypothetical protein